MYTKSEGYVDVYVSVYVNMYVGALAGVQDRSRQSR